MARRLMTIGVGVMIGIFIALGLGSDAGAASLVLYDNFTAPEINPDKWIGVDSFNSGPNPKTEAKRFIERGKLHIVLTTYGDTTSDSGTRSGDLGLGFPNPAAITAMEARVTVKQASFQDCAGNTSTSLAWAQLRGAFFNDGTSPEAGNRIGDIFTSFQKQANQNGNNITADIRRCNDLGCNNSTTLTSFIFTTTWTPGQAHVLRLEWDPAGNGFRFTVNPGKPTEETTLLTYITPDTLPPVFNFKNMKVRNLPANCTSGRKKVTMDALFDNVKLNPDAVP